MLISKTKINKNFFFISHLQLNLNKYCKRILHIFYKLLLKEYFSWKNVCIVFISNLLYSDLHVCGLKIMQKRATYIKTFMTANNKNDVLKIFFVVFFSFAITLGYIRCNIQINKACDTCLSWLVTFVNHIQRVLAPVFKVSTIKIYMCVKWLSNICES